MYIRTYVCFSHVLGHLYVLHFLSVEVVDEESQRQFIALCHQASIFISNFFFLLRYIYIQYVYICMYTYIYFKLQCMLIQPTVCIILYVAFPIEFHATVLLSLCITHFFTYIPTFICIYVPQLNLFV